MENRFLCIICNRRYFDSQKYMREKYLGICKACNDKLPRIPKDAVFAGTADVDSLFSVFYYKNPLKSSIIRYKFQSQTRYAAIYSELMYEYFKELDLQKDFDLITSVPLSRKRFFERGFNQTELLARPLAEKLGIAFSDNCLFKTRNTQKQSLVQGTVAKHENVSGAYLADYRKIDGKNILLVDDIFTSGATVQSCAKELLEKGAKHVTALTLAKTSFKNE